MTTQPSPYVETVKRTPLPEQNVEVVMLKRHDVHLLRPFLVFARDILSGEASGVRDLATAAAASHEHDRLVRGRPAMFSENFGKIRTYPEL